jgi:hypothetical protein
MLSLIVLSIVILHAILFYIIMLSITRPCSSLKGVHVRLSGCIKVSYLCFNIIGRF